MTFIEDNYQQTTRVAKALEARWDWSKKDFRRVIKPKLLIHRLQKHALGQVEMQNSAVRAAIALLDRVVPVLQSVEVKTEHVHRYVLEVPASSLSSADWERNDTVLTPADQQPAITHDTSKA